MGNMADIKAVVGFPEFKWDLNLPTKIRVWAGRAANGRGIFGDTRGGVFRAIENEFPDFDGGVIVRDDAGYKPAQEITSKVDEFKEVQADVYARREELKKAIARTSEALQAAETEAAEKKLEAILNAQYSQLAALDSEVALSAAEIQVRAAERVAMSDAQSEADAEARRKLAQEEAKKVGKTFKPLYGSVLLYVKEERFQP
jgi:type IV secretion system protein TrbJ